MPNATVTDKAQETRPSTPPPYTALTSQSSLTSHPYLQQLEEAISTPVPDLASTLTTPESHLRRSHHRIRSEASEGWDGRTVLRLSQDDEAPPTVDFFSTQAFQERSEAAIHRMQSELDRWQNERNRLRSILHDQQNRQSMLEDQNHRLREQRSRLQEEHTRLNEQSSRLNEQNTQLREQFLRMRQEQTNVDNLAGAIAEVGRDSYATTGSGPSRQRLYDWAATREMSRHSVQSHLEDESVQIQGDVDSAPRRELERALRNYRQARNAFRSGRHPATDLGAVPTASALRAYWNEDDSPPSDSSAGRTPFALSEFVEQHRLERQRRQLEDFRRQRERRNSQSSHSQNYIAPQDLIRDRRTSSDAFSRVRNSMRYLSHLRDTDNGIHFARALNLDTLYGCEESNAPNRLPMTIDTLPTPQSSSWLTPGMIWHGLQSTDKEQSRPAVLASTLRRMRQRDYVGRAMARRGMLESGSSSSYLPEATSLLHPHDADRYMSNLMQDSEGRWGFGDAADYTQLPGSVLDPQHLHPSTSSASDQDHWPVTVSLHSVDMDNMTVTGTMRASQIPDKSNPSSENTKSMESYFEGEILDFRKYTLETESRNREYRVGGVDVDACYWSRLGPFRSEIEKCATVRSPKGLWDGKTRVGAGKELELVMVAEERERRETEADEIMARCLNSSQWLQENLDKWVLMRWKEKCFAEPVIRGTTSALPVASNGSIAVQWGLTISGFYYIALNRETGEIEGLCYDSGSQPYQSLKLKPESCTRADVSDEQHPSRMSSGLGVKKWFPAVEFR